MISIVNTVKLKIDGLFGKNAKLSSEQRSEFVKALISHLAFTTKKIVDIIPELKVLPNNEDEVLTDFLKQELYTLQDIVFTFVNSAQEQGVDINQYFSEEEVQQSSLELGEILAHIEQTIVLLESNDSAYRTKMISILSSANQVIEKIDTLIDIVIEAQDSSSTKTLVDELNELSEKNFNFIITELQLSQEKPLDEKVISQLRSHLNDIISFVLEEVDAIAQQLTHDPEYSEQQAEKLSKAIRVDFFRELTESQILLIGYPRKIQPKKKEIVELHKAPVRKSASVPHMESSQIPIVPQFSQSPSPVERKEKKKRNIKFSLLRRRQSTTSKNLDSIVHNEEITYSPSTPTRSINTPKDQHGIISPASPKISPKKLPEPNILVNAVEKRIEEKKEEKKEEEEDNKEEKKHELKEENIEQKKDPKLELKNISIRKTMSLKDGDSVPTISMHNNFPPPPMRVLKEGYPAPKPELKRANTNTSLRFSQEVRDTDVSANFQSKRPKIARNVSKTRIFSVNRGDAPECILTSSILKVLENELPWFKEQWSKEHPTAVFRISNRIEELVKKDLVSYGNKVRGNSPVARAKLLSTPRGGQIPSDGKDLQKFVSPDVFANKNWKGLFSSTTTLLTPLEIPRLRACVSPLGTLANKLIATAFSVVDTPLNRNLRPKLKDSVKEYYDKLQQVVNICIGGPERQATLAFLDKPLEELIKNSPVEGVIDNDLLNTEGEEYKLQTIFGKIRKQVFHNANNFRALVIQIGSSINSIKEGTRSIDGTLVVQLVSNITSQLKQITDFLNIVATSHEFALNIKSQEARNIDESQLDNSLTATSINIWEAPPIEPNPDFNLGNLNSFVLQLTETEEQVNTYFMKAFLATYQAFTTPMQLFLKVVERYHVPPDIDQSIANKVRLRVVIVLKYWIQTQFYDINDHLLKRITKFLGTLKANGQGSIAQQLENLLESKEEDRKAQIRRIEQGELPPLDTNQLYDLNPVSPADVLFSSKPIDIATHITAQDASIFHAIELSELLNQAWSKPALRYQAPNVVRFIRSLNKLSFWVATSILWYSNVNTRSRVIEKFIGIAQHLRKIGNFNSLMGILGGLNLGCVSRLKQSFSGVSEKKKKKFKYLNEVLMVPKSSWKVYREELQKQPLPRLPYLGVHLSDLAFIGDGNPSEIDGLVNFDKHLMVYKVLEQILICQQQSYEFELVEPLRTFYSELPSLGEDELWKLSETREPRASE